MEGSLSQLSFIPRQILHGKCWAFWQDPLTHVAAVPLVISAEMALILDSPHSHMKRCKMTLLSVYGLVRYIHISLKPYGQSYALVYAWKTESNCVYYIHWFSHQIHCPYLWQHGLFVASGIYFWRHLRFIIMAISNSQISQMLTLLFINSSFSVPVYVRSVKSLDVIDSHKMTHYLFSAPGFPQLEMLSQP